MTTTILRRISQGALLLLASALPAYGVASCVVTDPVEGPVEQARQAVGEGWASGDNPSAPPLLLSWQTEIDTVTEWSALPLRVENPTDAAVSFTLSLVATGLDGRTVKRAAGTYTLAGHASQEQRVLLADMPIQSVSHSSELVVEAVIDGPPPLSLTTPPAFVHFSSDYTAAQVYGFDVMNDRLMGGQLAADGYVLEGRVWNGIDFTDINALRRTEALPGDAAPVLGTTWNAASIGAVDPVPPSGKFAICGLWTTRFVDAIAGDYANTSSQQEVPAAYAKAQVRKVTTDPCRSLSPDACTTAVWTGYLGTKGCLSFDAEKGEKYILKVSTEFRKLNDTASVVYFDPAGTDKGVQTLQGSFYIPITTPWGQPEVTSMEVRLAHATHANVAATVSRMLMTPDSGFAGKGPLTVNAGRGCNAGVGWPDAGIPGTDSCASLDVEIGPRTIPGSQAPGSMAWKYAIAHEIGHWIMYRQTQTTTVDFDELDLEPGAGSVPAECKCDHVVDLNRTHCLQSKERFKTASQEGLGHFIAAKIWNDATESDCEFNYYKEFLEVAGAPAKSPPYRVDCRNAIKWRNHHCFTAAHATEFDFMQFLWNLHTVGSDKLSMSEIGEIYKRACGGGPCAEVSSSIPPLTWSGLLQGAELYFGDPNHPKVVKVRNAGKSFGIDPDPAL